MNITNCTLCTLKLTPKKFRDYQHYMLRDILCKFKVGKIPIYFNLGYYKRIGLGIPKPHVYSNFAFDFLIGNDNVVHEINLTATDPIVLYENMSLTYTYNVRWIKSENKYTQNSNPYLDSDFFENKMRNYTNIMGVCISLTSILFLSKMCKQGKTKPYNSFSEITLGLSSFGISLYLAFVFFIFSNFFYTNVFEFISTKFFIPFLCLASFFGSIVLNKNVIDHIDYGITLIISILPFPIFIILLEAYSTGFLFKNSLILLSVVTFLIIFIDLVTKFFFSQTKEFHKEVGVQNKAYVLCVSLIIALASNSCIGPELFFVGVSILYRKMFGGWVRLFLSVVEFGLTVLSISSIGVIFARQHRIKITSNNLFYGGMMTGLCYAFSAWQKFGGTPGGRIYILILSLILSIVSGSLSFVGPLFIT